MREAMRRWLNEVDHWAGERLSWAAERPRWAAAFLIVLCLVLYLPGFATLPVTDRDEPRFAQATKQMLETGNFVDIRFQQEPRYKKPIGIHWLQSLSVSVLSPGDLTQIWAYRVPSLIGIVLGVLLTWWAARPIFGRENALLAAILMATVVDISLEARIAKSDAALFASTVAMQGALARLYLFRGIPSGRVAALFWVALGIGILIKGPVAPALSGLTIVTLLIFDRDRSWLKNFHALWGVPLMLAMTLPWFIAIGITSNWEFYRLAFGEDFLAKLGSGKEKHWGPPGFYFVAFWAIFWPASLISTGSVALWLWRKRGQRRVLFLLAWIVPFWIALEATPTKLPHYALPLFPAIAMAAVWVLREMLDGRIPLSRAYRYSAVLWLLVALALAGMLAFCLFYFKVAPSLWLVAMAPIYVTLAVATAWAAWNGAFRAAFVAAVASAILIYTAAFRLVAPSIHELWPSRQIADVVTALRPCAKGPLFSVFREPSMVFLVGTDTQFLNRGVRIIPEAYGANHLLIVDESNNVSGHPPLACINGFNINGGKSLQLRVVASGAPEAYAACPIPERYRCQPK
jgi:4-amino-4-deoxy-L-arabinose transferase-like glycosyltransferase